MNTSVLKRQLDRIDHMSFCGNVTERDFTPAGWPDNSSNIANYTTFGQILEQVLFQQLQLRHLMHVLNHFCYTKLLFTEINSR